MEKKKYLDECGVFQKYLQFVSMINYISGIDKFDQLFMHKKFAESKLLHAIRIYEDSYEFVLSYKKSEETYLLLKKDFIELLKHNDQEIDVLKVGKVGAIKWITGVAFLVTGLLMEKFAEAFSNVTSEIVKGTVWEIKYLINDQIRTIKLSSETKLDYDVSKFFDKHFNTKFVERDHSSNCYIASAVYGSKDSEEVKVLRNFRDSFLIKTRVGRIFISLYYIFSPKIAQNLKGKNKVNSSIRFLLGPLVEFIKKRKL